LERKLLRITLWHFTVKSQEKYKYNSQVLVSALHCVAPDCTAGWKINQNKVALMFNAGKMLLLEIYKVQ
jgi:hypothetical protein